jgi:hypothetical protein
MCSTVPHWSSGATGAPAVENSTGQPRWAFKWVVWRADYRGPPLAPRVRQRTAA